MISYQLGQQLQCSCQAGSYYRVELLPPLKQWIKVKLSLYLLSRTGMCNTFFFFFFWSAFVPFWSVSSVWQDTRVWKEEKSWVQGMGAMWLLLFATADRQTSSWFHRDHFQMSRRLENFEILEYENVSWEIGTMLNHLILSLFLFLI